MTPMQRLLRTARKMALALLGHDVRITHKQRGMLGNAYSERIGQLLAKLEMLSGEETIFDRDIEDDPVYGHPGGVCRLGESVPRISLPIGAPEVVVAHELLHGILHYEHYPRVISAWRNRFPFLTDVGWELMHCALHVVIDYRLQGLGYDVLAARIEAAEGLLAALPKIRVNCKDAQWEHMVCIRLARRAAEQSSIPPIPASLAARFEADARRYFPACRGLIEKLKGILAGMDVHDPRNVQASLRRMLAAVEQEYGAYAYFKNLYRLSVIAPVFLTTAQLRKPAGDTVRADVGMLRSQGQPDKLLPRSEFVTCGDVRMFLHGDPGRNGTLVVVADRLSRETLILETSKDVDENKIRLLMDELLKEPLRDYLDYSRIPYVELRD
jgi:hypothetical protein